ncbi:MAG: L-arabinose isomerase [Bacteroidales bacterium]
MQNRIEKTLWFLTGSQHLYGEEVLNKVAENSKEIAAALDTGISSLANIVFKSVLTTSEEILGICLEANNDPGCIGLICWMHTFSPAQMWIGGLKALQKPFIHLHTQHNRDIPWDKIDMDFMNLNQSAHGDREFGFICSRIPVYRHVVTGHWRDPAVIADIAGWTRAALGRDESLSLKVARFGDNMRDVAVTEGDKVEARMKMGWAVRGYGVGDLAGRINAVTEKEAFALVDEYRETYSLPVKIKDDREAFGKLTEAAKIEIGLLDFLQEGGFKAFTTTFEDLHGLSQLPGLAVQRLMEKGYGFGAEGDWKTAALVRCMKVMSRGLDGGTSFMEDYTYHLDPSGMMVLGAHMLEVCPSIASAKPSLELHPLSIGGRDDPPRLVFPVATGKAVNATLLDLGSRFRMLVNTVTAVDSPDLPKLPVARALWIPDPDLKISATAWILAGGAHHTGFSLALKPEHIEHFSGMTGIEYLLIDEDTTIREFRNVLRWNELYYKLNG